jgi:hypothetical protein
VPKAGRPKNADSAVRISEKDRKSQDRRAPEAAKEQHAAANGKRLGAVATLERGKEIACDAGEIIVLADRRRAELEAEEKRGKGRPQKGDSRVAITKAQQKGLERRAPLLTLPEAAIYLKVIAGSHAWEERRRAKEFDANAARSKAMQANSNARKNSGSPIGHALFSKADEQKRLRTRAERIESIQLGGPL